MSLLETADREIKIDSRTGIYYYRGTPLRGMKELIRSLKVRNFRTAVQAKRELLWKLRGVDPSEKNILFKDYANNVFLVERKRRARATYEQAYYSVKAMLPFFETYTMRQINDRVWAEYVEYSQEVSPGRLLRYDRRHLLMMLRRLYKKGVVSEIPELVLEEPKVKRRGVLSREKIEAIFKFATGTLYGLALFMHKMGPRPGEVLGAKWEEFDFKKGIWHIPAERVKTRVGRSIVINPQVLEWLKARRVNSVRSEYVFPSRENPKRPVRRYNKQWDRMIEAENKAAKENDTQPVLDKEITPYYLRHTFLTEAAKRVREGKLSLVLITKYAGTSIEEFERTYLHIDGEDTKDVATIMDIGELPDGDQ